MNILGGNMKNYKILLRVILLIFVTFLLNSRANNIYSFENSLIFDSPLLKNDFYIILSELENQQLEGDYYIPKGNHIKGFTTLDSAFKSLNTYGASGQVRFLIDDNLEEDANNLYLNRADLSSSTILIIKPNIGKKPQIKIKNCSVDGPNQFSGIGLINTSFVVIDGSNTENGNTIDLEINLLDTINGRRIINIYGNCDNITIKNVLIKYHKLVDSNSLTYGIFVEGIYSYGGTDSLLIFNTIIGDSMNPPSIAINIDGNSDITRIKNIYIKNNIIYSNRVGINIDEFGIQGTYTEISGNRIYSLTNLGTINGYRFGILFDSFGGVIDIHNNKFQNFRSLMNDRGIKILHFMLNYGISSVNIYNNFFGGDLVNSGVGLPQSFDIISINSNGALINIWFNTFVINELITNTESEITCVKQIGNGSNRIDCKNNIFLLKANHPKAYAIYKSGWLLSFTSDHNAFFVSDTLSFLGFWDTPIKTLEQWRIVSGQDYNSLIEEPSFVSELDFHIPDGTITNLESAGTPIQYVKFDIDGQIRDTLVPDIGADEFIGINPKNYIDTVNINLRSGWNLVSLPVKTIKNKRTDLFPFSISNAFWFDGQSYISEDTIKVGKGYWLKFSVDTLQSVIGIKLDTIFIKVHQGWNLIGTTYKDLNVDNVITFPSNLIISKFYGFLNGYYLTNILKKGEGFWVKTNSSGYIILINNNFISKKKSIFLKNNDNNWCSINIRDSRNFSQNLYLADKENFENYELPPLPPNTLWDVRFNSGKYVEFIDNPQKILIQGAEYPIIIKIANLNKNKFLIKYSIDNSVKEFILNDNDELIIDDIVESLEIQKFDIPHSYNLYQNYPNPFNSSTVITYSLPENTEVTIDIFDVLGRKIKSLQNNEYLQKGTYNIKLDASSFISGVYFVKFETKKFNKTIKIMVIK